MKFGIHSLLFSETFLERDLPLLDKAKAMGFEAMEIIPFDSENFPAGTVRRRAAELELDIIIGYGMPAEFNIISADAETRRRGVDFTKYLIDLGVEAGAKVFCGVNYCSWGYLTGRMRSADEWAWGVEGYRAIADYALRYAPDLMLAIEPINRFESHFLNVTADALAFIRDVDHPNVKVHLDTFHMIREEDDFAGAVRHAGRQLGYVHACENQRGVPGRGQVPWREFFSALRDIGYDGYLTIESFDADMPNIAKLCCIWRKLAESPDQLASDGLAFLKTVHAGIQEEDESRRAEARVAIASL